jgi:cytochrome P450
VPVEVIGNLLAVPRDEREPLRDWSLAILGALEPTLTPEQQARGEKAVEDFLAYLKSLVARRRAKPGDPEHDVLTRLIEGEQDGERLSERELLHNIIFILNAGHETTTNLVGNGLYALLEWPEEKARLLRQPELIRTAVEEFLRFESPNQLGNRLALTPVDVAGVAIPAGTYLTIGIGAANRDPAEFPDPDRLDVARVPNRHLAFGSGPHVCIGLNVARLEGRIAIGRFLARFPGYTPSGEPVRGGRARFPAEARHRAAIRNDGAPPRKQRTRIIYVRPRPGPKQPSRARIRTVQPLVSVPFLATRTVANKQASAVIVPLPTADRLFLCSEAGKVGLRVGSLMVFLGQRVLQG